MKFDRTEALRICGELIALHADTLSAWEDEFVCNIELRLARNETLTQAQQDKLMEVAKRYGVKLYEGKTISEDELWR